MTHNEIGDILNKQSGNDWDESAYRKKYTPFIEGYNEGYDKGYREGMSIEDKEKEIFIDELREERELHYKSKRKLQDKLREYRGYLTTEARAENLRSVVLQSVDEMNTNYPLLETGELKVTDDERVGVLQISDWHYGEIFEDNLNMYNTAICRDRVRQLAEKTIYYVNSLNLKELKILNLGDLVAGNIRISARVMNETDIISQITEVSEILCQFLGEIQRKTCIKLTFYTVLDNHSRVSSNYNQHVEAESFARILPWYLQGRLADNDNIEIVESKVDGIQEYDIGRFKIYDSDFLFVHGHNDKLRSAITDISMLTKINPVSIFMGHLHRNIEDEDFEIDLIVNPSLIGSGAFSKTIRKSSKPRQKLNIYNRKDNNEAYREGMMFIEFD